MPRGRRQIIGQQQIDDRLIEFESAVADFSEKGGEADFLRYAWNLALVSADPSWLIKAKGEHAREYRDTGRRHLGLLKKQRDQLSALQEDLPKDDLKPALAAVEKAEARAKHQAEAAFFAEMGHFPRSGPSARPRRYVLFGAVWPYMKFKRMGSERWRWQWLSNWFNLDDATEPADRAHLRGRFKKRGFPFSAITTEKFELHRLHRDDRHADIARQWWKGAKHAHKSFLSSVASSANAYLLWKRRIAMTPEEIIVMPVKCKGITVADKTYARQAWAFLEKDVRTGLRGLPDRFPVRDLAC